MRALQQNLAELPCPEDAECVYVYARSALRSVSFYRFVERDLKWAQVTLAALKKTVQHAYEYCNGTVVDFPPNPFPTPTDITAMTDSLKFGPANGGFVYSLKVDFAPDHKSTAFVSCIDKIFTAWQNKLNSNFYSTVLPAAIFVFALGTILVCAVVLGSWCVKKLFAKSKNSWADSCPRLFSHSAQNDAGDHELVGINDDDNITNGAVSINENLTIDKGGYFSLNGSSDV